MFTAGEIFSIAVKIEENGERFYREALAGSTEPALKELFQWLADEEARHKNYFLEIKTSLNALNGAPWDAQMGEAILQSVVKDRMFSLEEVQVNSIKDENDLIRVGLELEEDSIKFYEIIVSFLDDAETVKHINEIIKEERKHAEYLTKRTPAQLF